MAQLRAVRVRRVRTCTRRGRASARTRAARPAGSRARARKRRRDGRRDLPSPSLAPRRAGSADPWRHPMPPTRSILLVEEDAVCRGFLADNLTADGYEVIVAADKTDALAKLRLGPD